ncbi:MAG: hypothetical protein U1E28_05030 [Beijerinckiaceae bacterium]
MYGNRGGRFHRDDRTLGASRWKSRMWIICLLQFKGRRNDVFGRRYTDLFFADEPTALAAGHRPCFYCRREAASAFIAALDDRQLDRAPKLDARLDAERRIGRAKRVHTMKIDDLPDGAMFAEGPKAFAVRGDAILEWSFSGYGKRAPRPKGGDVAVLTPPTTLVALRNGYAPQWHPTAGA